MSQIWEVVFKEEVQRLFDLFSSCLGIRIVFYDAEGQLLRKGRDSRCREDCTFCSLIQEQLYTPDKCLQMNQECAAEAVQKRGVICNRCHAELIEAIRPIFDENHVVGYAMIGQMRGDETLASHVDQAWDEKYGDSRLHEAFEQLPHLSEQRINHIVELFDILMEHVVSQHMVFLRGDPLRQEILAYMEEHFCEPITLADVANAVCRSTSSVSHAFRTSIGGSFKSTLIEMRLVKAEQEMRSSTNVSVKSAAFRSGFTDPYYFSRVYKKYRGISPKEFIERYGRTAHRASATSHRVLGPALPGLY